MSNAAGAKNRRNPEGEGALGCLAAFLAAYRSLRTCSSLAPCHPAQTALAQRGWVLQQTPKWLTRSGRLSPLTFSPFSADRSARHCASSTTRLAPLTVSRPERF